MWVCLSFSRRERGSNGKLHNHSTMGFMKSLSMFRNPGYICFLLRVHRNEFSTGNCLISRCMRTLHTSKTENLSRKGAKAQRKNVVFSLRLCAFAGVMFFAAFVAVIAQTTHPALPPSERRGKEIYLRGISSSGREIPARLNDLDVPA